MVFCSLLIEYTENKGNDSDRWKGYVYVVSMVAVATCQVMAVQHGLHISFTSAMRVHSSVIGAVYAKVKKLILSGPSLLMSDLSFFTPLVAFRNSPDKETDTSVTRKSIQNSIVVPSLKRIG